MSATIAIAVDDATRVGEARRAAALLAGRLGFSDERAGTAALVASELAANLARHARSGEFLLSPVDAGDGQPADALEMLALDRGPGIPDLALSFRDGFSTAGSLGQGLGAIRRQSDLFDVYSRPGGTAVLSRIWRTAPAGHAQARVEAGGINVAMAGEPVCGDAWTWRLSDAGFSIFAADGLGHGVHANEAAMLAVRIFGQTHAGGPQRVINDVHAGLRSTRGAAVAALDVDLDQGAAVYAGLGNVACTVIEPGGTRQGLVSHNGTAGHMAARVQEFRYRYSGQAVVIMYTDGLISHWTLDAYPGLLGRHPTLVAGVLYRDFSRRRDDVTVVVARQRQQTAR